MKKLASVFFLVFMLFMQTASGSVIMNTVMIYELEQLASKGDLEARFKLARHYKLGDKVAQDLNKAIALYEENISENHMPSKYELGLLYLQPAHPKQDKEKGLSLIKEAAEPESDIMAFANYGLGVIYLEGAHTVAQNIPKGLSLIEKAASFNSTSAMRYLAKIYIEREQFKDYKKGKYWLEKIIETKSSDPEFVDQNEILSSAYSGLGQLEFTGAIDKKNIEKADEYFYKLIKLESPEHLYTAGHYYETGAKSRLPNIRKAREFYTVAEKLGSKKAETRLRVMPEYTPINSEFCRTSANKKYLTAPQSKHVQGYTTVSFYQSIYRYLRDRDSFVESSLKQGGYSPSFLAKLDKIKEQLTNHQKYYIDEYIDYGGSVYVFFSDEYIKKHSVNSDDLFDDCYWLQNLIGPHLFLESGFHNSDKQGRFGGFEISLNSCDVKSKISGKGAKPENIPGTKYIVVDAEFKNTS